MSDMSEVPTDASDVEPIEPPVDHECPEDDSGPVLRKGDVSAASRGWGPGWPTNNSSKMATVRAAGIALSVRSELAPLVESLVKETAARGYALRHGECWGFANRAIRGTNRPSNHSWGLAVDLNAPANPMGAHLVTDMPGWMVELWTSKRFRWGGNYTGRKDAMHYEFMGTPDDARHLAGEATGGGGGTTVTATGPLLKRSAKGPDVRRLQERLNAHGARLRVDGDFGPATEQAVRAFQQGRGLDVDGKVGPRTWAALG